MKTLHLLIIGIVIITGTSTAFLQSSTAQMQNVTSPTYFKCIDNMTQNMKTKYASFDEERAKTEALNYNAFKSEVNGDKYKFVAVSQEWINDQVKCNVTLKTVLVLFIVTDNSGKDRDVTVMVNPESYQPKGIDVVHEIVTHGGGVLTTLSLPLKQFKSGIPAADVTCSVDYVLTLKSTDRTPACVKPETKIQLLKRGWAIPGPKDFGYNPGRGPVTLEKQTPTNFSSLGPNPFSPSTLNRIVFFMKSNSTAQIYVQYTSDFSNLGNVTTGGQGYTGNPHNFIPLNSSQIAISSNPDHVSMSLGTNTTVVYTVSTKNTHSGLYWMFLTQICGVIPIAIDMNSSQITPSDIPVYSQHCPAQFLDAKILGISGGTIEYKLSQELQ